MAVCKISGVMSAGSHVQKVVALQLLPCRLLLMAYLNKGEKFSL